MKICDTEAKTITPTMNLRWFKGELQQAWQDVNTGEIEWHEIETVNK